MLSLVAARLRQREGVDSLSDSKTESSDDSAKRNFGQRVPLSVSASKKALLMKISRPPLTGNGAT
jgi:hypothetical protein